MSILIRPKSRLSLAYTDPSRLLPNHAPQTPSVIDWGHDLSKGLAFSALARSHGLDELVQRNAAFTATHSGARPSLSMTPDGLAFRTTGASGHSSFSLGASQSLGAANDFTTMCVFNLSAIADWGTPACWSVNGGSSRIEISKESGGNIYVQINNTWSLGWNITFPLNKLTAVIGTHDGSTAAIHLFNSDGYQKQSLTDTETAQYAIDKLTIGASTGGLSTRHATGLVYQADIRQGVLGDDEIERLLRDAYQYYAPANDAPYVLVDPVARPRYEGRGSGNGACATSTATFTPAIPPDIQVGDLMLFLGHIDGGRTINSMTAGWTALSISNSALPKYWKIYEEGDSAPTLSLSGNEKGLCYIFRISGADETAPIDDVQQGGRSDGTATCPDATASVGNCLLLRGMRLDSTTVASAVEPTGTTLIDGFPHQCGTTAGPVGGGWAYEDQINSGSTGTADWTGLSVGTNQGVTIVIKPPAAPAPPGGSAHDEYYKTLLQGGHL